MSLYDEFRTFIFEQDENRFICHGGGWHSCAVGDFMFDRQQMLMKEYDIRGTLVLAKAMLMEEDKRMKTLYNILNDNGYFKYEVDDINLLVRFNDYFGEEDTIETYGQLQDFIEIMEEHVDEPANCIYAG